MHLLKSSNFEKTNLISRRSARTTNDVTSCVTWRCLPECCNIDLRWVWAAFQNRSGSFAAKWAPLSICSSTEQFMPWLMKNADWHLGMPLLIRCDLVQASSWTETNRIGQWPTAANLSKLRAGLMAVSRWLQLETLHRFLTNQSCLRRSYPPAAFVFNFWLFDSKFHFFLHRDPFALIRQRHVY